MKIANPRNTMGGLSPRSSALGFTALHPARVLFVRAFLTLNIRSPTRGVKEEAVESRNILDRISLCMYDEKLYVYGVEDTRRI